MKKIFISIGAIIVLLLVAAGIYGVSISKTAQNKVTGAKSASMPQMFFNDSRTGFVFKYSDGSGFSMTVPLSDGTWNVDTDTAQKIGVAAVFYKTGKTFSTSPVTMYVRRVVYTEKFAKDFAGLITNDKAQFKKEYAGIKISDLNPIVTDGASRASIVSYANDTYPRYEETAYIDADGAGDMIVVSAVSKDELQKALPLFNAMVKSYTYLPEVKQK